MSILAKRALFSSLVALGDPLNDRAVVNGVQTSLDQIPWTPSYQVDLRVSRRLGRLLWARDDGGNSIRGPICSAVRVLAACYRLSTQCNNAVAMISICIPLKNGLPFLALLRGKARRLEDRAKEQITSMGQIRGEHDKLTF